MLKVKEAEPMTEQAIVKPRANQKEWLEEKILVEFRNLEEPNMIHTFSYGPSKKVKTYKLVPGGKYELSRELVNHLNTRAVPDYRWVPDGLGNMTKKLIGTKPRFQCSEVFV